MQRVSSSKQVGILDKSLSKGKTEVNLSSFALLFAEMVRYANNHSNTVSELQEKLADYGKFVGSRLLDVIVVREKGYRREIKLLNMLMFVKGTVWKNLFNKEADKLERSNDDPCQYLLIEKEPIVNTYISIPRDKGTLNCASFIAGIIEAILEACNFPCKSCSGYGRICLCDNLQAFYLAILTSSKPSFSSDTGQSGKALKPITLVPLHLHQYLFGKGNVPKNVASDQFTQLELPKLLGTNLQEHFKRIGEIQVAEEKKLLDYASNIRVLPAVPSKWNFEVGWTKYDSKTGNNSLVEFPDEEILFFDVEVCVCDGQLPTLAVAVSPTSWYSWCSERLVNNSRAPKLYQLKDLIPLESVTGGVKKKVIIGHNVAYDRSRVREEYIRQTKVQFWDTMSMAIPIYGMADHQVKLYEKNDVDDNEEEQHTGWYDEWRSRVSRNSLFALHQKLYGKTSKLKLDKSMQNFFVKESINEIRANFQCLMQYCADDVKACQEIYQAMYPEFVKRFPSPTTWMGMIEMANAYLPITDNWRKFYDNCQERAVSKNNSSAHGLLNAARHLVEELSVGEKYKNDPWMWHEDWVQNKHAVPNWYVSMLRNKKLSQTSVSELNYEDVKLKSHVIPFIFGLCYGLYPIHYKYEKGYGFLVPKGMSICKYGFLEDMEANGLKSKYTMEVALRRGCTARIPYEAIMKLITTNQDEGVGDVVLNEPDFDLGPFNFHRLPHPRGNGFNVGDPLAKDFYLCIEEGVIRPTRFQKEFDAFLNAKKTTRFWNNYRERFEEQVPVWLDDNFKEGALAPSVIPAGTVTRRAVHKLWLTAINSKSLQDEEMIGNELKSMVECPEGWYLVGADVDSQEQWIAAMLGDSAIGCGVAGATPFSNMLLAGSKSDHSDLHSVVAKEVNISRDKAKVLNYARLYGAGAIHAMDFLKQSGMNEIKAKEVTKKLFEKTKGRRSKYLMLSKVLIEVFKDFLEQCPDDVEQDYIFLNGHYFLPDTQKSEKCITSVFEAWLMNKLEVELKGNNHLNRELLVSRIYENNGQPTMLYSDGYESSTFNYLELMLRQQYLRTPVLECQLGYGLEPLPNTVPDANYFLLKYRRSIINWVVQSSAVDFLHLLLSCMKWLCTEYEIEARFVISIHDEIRYMVKAEDRYRCALALMLSNMLVRAMISQKLGVSQLPLSVAFFSQVDIDRVLRKETNLVCKTPDGITRPPGEALDIYKVIEKTKGFLRKDGINN
uniref:Mitochondrial DNA polymerase catalytic subunit n=1 Tax=Syphacia muris TaxID=451379 RepID=A0A0N5AUE9_9BILA